jgi:hypothetical protein
LEYRKIPSEALKWRGLKINCRFAMSYGGYRLLIDLGVLCPEYSGGLALLSDVFRLILLLLFGFLLLLLDKAYVSTGHAYK